MSTPMRLLRPSLAKLAPCSCQTVLHRRAFSSSRISRRPADPSDDAGGRAERIRDRAAVGPFTLRAGAVFALTGAGLYLYFQNEKSKLQERKKQEMANQKIGRPKIGGSFKLQTTDGKDFTQDDILGGFHLIYFGFTNCPDICPEELDKMGKVVDEIERIHGSGTIRPIFVTCDPARDSREAVGEYLKDFHPRMVGLTGSYDDIKRACKVYRVYFSTPPNAKSTDDYLVDHSIFFYLMDPEGAFVDAFGRSFTKEDVQTKTDGYIREYKGGKRWKE
ncbi:uncharacterized protein L969DRAFT_348481 [Mixia osmundae IAM 14324]|uniref:Thioredoxin domain-containing protein n=1 Tax=Mixia osmundae (strain CBS 9802 / IAM 14324 / JCM 22182 / KY 12970) TaxID=764103 RepID=G7E5R0_MIXOS|nr:uncharacterized protein L969DRAFT_348481 [Mixia osmundae IAM 14324]KEI40680.1 hypothetical protein L969DRAFT_348481 [Mixia osmundae IAM 14324]GAA98170.1 hypothetical protein E5Q_04853 [Mixia osmundae IAM 14324]